MSRLERITSDPGVCHGQPTVRGLRYPVESLLELLSSRMTIDEVVDAQLPARLARFLNDAGHDALHTDFVEDNQAGPRGSGPARPFGVKQAGSDRPAALRVVCRQVAV